MVKKNTLTIIGVVIGVFILIIAGVIGIPKIVDSLRGGGGGGDDDNKTVEEPNIPPTAILKVDKEMAREGEGVTFDGNESFDIDYEGNLTNRGIFNYIWDWGDGSKLEKTENGTVIHVFSEQGIYDVKMTVIDEDNAMDNATVTIQIVPQDVLINSGTQILIGEPLIPGIRIISNTTEVNWTIKKNAMYMELNITVTGFYAQEISSNKVDLLLYNPYEKLMANETVEVMGTEQVSWEFDENDIKLPGEYYVFIHCTKGAAFVSVEGFVTYIER
ncbi:MAG: PKD domain-containing protein [Thermoplasmatota archaeon]